MGTREYVLDVVAPDGGVPRCAARFAVVCLDEQVVVKLATSCCDKAQAGSRRARPADCVTAADEALWLDEHWRPLVPAVRIPACPVRGFGEPGRFESVLHTDGRTLSFRLSNWFGHPAVRVVTAAMPVMPLVSLWMRLPDSEVLRSSGLMTRLVQVQAETVRRESRNFRRPVPPLRQADALSASLFSNPLASRPMPEPQA